jgi:hypothetical protein
MDRDETADHHPAGFSPDCARTRLSQNDESSPRLAMFGARGFGMRNTMKHKTVYLSGAPIDSAKTRHEVATLIGGFFRRDGHTQ